MSNKIEELKKVYAEILRDKVQNDPEYNWPDKSDTAINKCVDKMMAAAGRPGNRADWLKSNPALRTAAKKVGINKSSELRALCLQK